MRTTILAFYKLVCSLRRLLLAVVLFLIAYIVKNYAIDIYVDIVVFTLILVIIVYDFVKTTMRWRI